jgi:uncharacterized protein YuzE
MLIITFDNQGMQVRRSTISAVLDFDRSENVIGVEIINLLLQAGKNCLGRIRQSVSATDAEMKFSYDDECDCAYLRLRAGESLQQSVTDTELIFDDSGHIVEMRINLPG